MFRPGDVSYLRIAAPDPVRSAAFYGEVFGWKTRADSNAFQDATGHIIGHFMADLPVAARPAWFRMFTCEISTRPWRGSWSPAARWPPSRIPRVICGWR